LKNLLTLTAIFEGITGIALIIVPGFVVSLLLGTVLNEPAGIFVSRLAGVALMTFGIICWLHRNNLPGALGTVKALTFYNIAAAVLLLVAFINGCSGVALWPALLLHVGLAIWCLKTSIKVN
jgi:hypothetical protein